ncbi:MAG: hypothetical protein NTZ80_00475, partial [Patescibacteria group bacterium]|nr:hypothetical protein [Patescibacteria group bacterium]
ISNSKNCYHCFSCAECEDCRYCDGLLSGGPNQDCMDISNFGIGVQHCYESQCVGGNPGMTFNALFCNLCWPCDNLFYCHFCVNSTSDCFGCIGLKHGKYCILNKQYTKLEYEKLMAKIIEHMQKTDEWGQFFNPILSPFGHNETVAQEYFPFTKEKAVSKDFKWSDYESPLPEVAKIIAANKLPNSIIQVPNEILDWAIQCELTKKPFRIIKQELDFYRKYDLPLPKRYPEQRHLDRMALRNPRKLWHRVCDNNDCKIEFESSYSHDRPEKVYCEECYKKEIY